MKGLVGQMEKKICVTSDCVCDLPEELLEEYNVEIIYFYITTAQGCFKDMDEITSANVIEYFNNGGQNISTTAPGSEEYEEFFQKKLQQYDEVIHITIASSVSKSKSYASIAAEKFNGKVHVYDSEHLSAGLGYVVIYAAELAAAGKSSEEIIAALDVYKNKVCTSFIAENADYLYRNGKVSKMVMTVCSTFKIHPVLKMINGEMKLGGVQIGNYSKSMLRYVRGELKKNSDINKRRLFIIHADCSVKTVSRVKAFAGELCQFDEVIVASAAATITSNCGANALGVIFVKE